MVASQLEDSENRVIIEIVLTKHAEENLSCFLHMAKLFIFLVFK